MNKQSKKKTPPLLQQTSQKKRRGRRKRLFVDRRRESGPHLRGARAWSGRSRRARGARGRRRRAPSWAASTRTPRASTRPSCAAGRRRPAEAPARRRHSRRPRPSPRAVVAPESARLLGLNQRTEIGGDGQTARAPSCCVAACESGAVCGRRERKKNETHTMQVALRFVQKLYPLTKQYRGTYRLCLQEQAR
jgi:hypothetical protein